MKKTNSIFFYVITIIAIILTITVYLIRNSTGYLDVEFYNLQKEASRLTAECFEEIKEYKSLNNIPLSNVDKYSCGMIGNELKSDWTEVTTTSGDLDAKLTSCNPNFAALYIKFFDEVGLKEGDEVAVCFSGSFPTLDIASLAACQVYGLKVCLMPTIGSSTYGANSAELTIYDMIKILNKSNLISYKIDYVSFGGSSDTGREFKEDTYLIFTPESIYDMPYYKIKDRIEKNNDSNIYLEMSNFKDNIDFRMEKIFEKCPNCKMLISVGGNIVTMGKGEVGAEKINLYGLIKPGPYSIVSHDTSKEGLIDKFLKKNLPVIHLLNVKSLCIDYDIPYAPDTIPYIGSGGVYHKSNYNIVPAIIAVVTVLTVGVVYFVVNKKKNKDINRRYK